MVYNYVMRLLRLRFRYISKVTSLAPQQEDSSGVPEVPTPRAPASVKIQCNFSAMRFCREGVLLLGGTFVVRGEEAPCNADKLFGWCEAVARNAGRVPCVWPL